MTAKVKKAPTKPDDRTYLCVSRIRLRAIVDDSRPEDTDGHELEVLVQVFGEWRHVATLALADPARANGAVYLLDTGTLLAAAPLEAGPRGFNLALGEAAPRQELPPVQPPSKVECPKCGKKFNTHQGLANHQTHFPKLPCYGKRSTGVVCKGCGERLAGGLHASEKQAHFRSRCTAFFRTGGWEHQARNPVDGSLAKVFVVDRGPKEDVRRRYEVLVETAPGVRKLIKAQANHVQAFELALAYAKGEKS